MADRPRDSGHVVEDGVVVGNVVDKARLQNPIARWMVAHFDRTLLSLVRSLAPASIHEVGCGEGRLTRLLASSFDIPIRATDVSRSIIAELRGSDERIRYERRSIYDLDPIDDSADVIVCCEVLEHLDRPGAALRALRSLSARAFVLSVPREPLWRILNVVRGKYWRDLGNTPGHLQHWSSSAFRELLETSGFRVDDRRQPLPWTMVLARRRPEVFEQRSDSRDLAPQCRRLPRRCRAGSDDPLHLLQVRTGDREAASGQLKRQRRPSISWVFAGTATGGCGPAPLRPD